MDLDFIDAPSFAPFFQDTFRWSHFFLNPLSSSYFLIPQLLMPSLFYFRHQTHSQLLVSLFMRCTSLIVLFTLCRKVRRRYTDHAEYPAIAIAISLPTHDNRSRASKAVAVYDVPLLGRLRRPLRTYRGDVFEGLRATSGILANRRLSISEAYSSQGSQHLRQYWLLLK